MANSYNWDEIDLRAPWYVHALGPDGFREESFLIKQRGFLEFTDFIPNDALTLPIDRMPPFSRQLSLDRWKGMGDLNLVSPFVRIRSDVATLAEDIRARGGYTYAYDQAVLVLSRIIARASAAGVTEPWGVEYELLRSRPLKPGTTYELIQQLVSREREPRPVGSQVCGELKAPEAKKLIESLEPNHYLQMTKAGFVELRKLNAASTVETPMDVTSMYSQSELVETYWGAGFAELLIDWEATINFAGHLRLTETPLSRPSDTPVGHLLQLAWAQRCLGIHPEARGGIIPWAAWEDEMTTYIVKTLSGRVSHAVFAKPSFIKKTS